MIIGLTGLARCGKNTAADYLKKKYGFEVLVFSDILVEEAEKKGMKPTKMNLSILGDELREKQGNAVLAKKLLEKINPEKNYVLNGVRSPEEADYIRNELLNFYLIYVYANKVIRFKRRKQDDPQTEAKFFERDERDIENKGLGKTLKMADYRIDNSSDLNSLYKQADELMEKIKEEEK